jgi:hypothetical protein
MVLKVSTYFFFQLTGYNRYTEFQNVKFFTWAVLSCQIFVQNFDKPILQFKAPTLQLIALMMLKRAFY